MRSRAARAAYLRRIAEEDKDTRMALAPSVRRSRSLRGALVASLIAGALSLPGAARAEVDYTNVVDCIPSAGEKPPLKLSPAAVLPPDIAKYGVKLKTTLDGCSANASLLADWVTSKNGTADGASIAQAEISLTLGGYGNCSLGLLALVHAPETPGQFDPVGTLKITWLDANGEKIKSAKPSSAFVHLVPLTPDPFAVLASVAEGTVTKGLGIGSNVRVTIPLDLAIAAGTDFLSNPWALCAFSGTATPGLPPIPEGKPLKELGTKARPRVTIRFADSF
jgi:hypothetical protein